MYKSNSHNNAIVSGLNELRQHADLCDVTLIAEEKSFYAHKTVLVASSSYMRQLFHGDDGFKNEAEVIEVRGVTADGLKHLINFIYTSELHLSMKNVNNILSAAGHMEIKPILNFCKMFLISEISVYNCVDIIHIAETFSLPSVEEKAYDFIAEHLNELVKTDELQKLTVENMSLLLDSYSLKNVSELELFDAARQWLLYDSERYQHVRKLMEKIHFPLIPPRDLLRYVNFVEFMRMECNYLLLEASNYHMLPHSQPILQSVRTQVRSNDKRMVVIGGVDPHDRVSNQLYACNEDSSKTEFLPPMHEGLCSHCAVVMNNFLYVVGGQNMFDERGTTAVSTVIRYDPRFNIWMRIASMNDKRAGFTASVMENRIYALGGVNAAGRMSSMECYSLEDDRWRYVASVQAGLCDHAEAVHGNLIYISGGFKEGRFSNQMLAYSPRHDTWHERTPMHFARGWHAMVAFGDSIFVTGGNAGLNKRVDIHESEIYNAMTDQWTLVCPLPLAHSEGGCEFYNGKIFVVGGYSWAQQKCLNTIQCYDPTKDSWESPGSLPIELSGVRLVTLTIPYAVSPRTSSLPGTHNPLAWPAKDARLMMGANQMLQQGPMSMSFPGAAVGVGGPLPSGFVDPYSMAEFRDTGLFGTYSNDRYPGPKGVMNKPYQASTSNLSKTTSEATSALEYPSESGQESDSVYSHPRRQNYYGGNSSAASMSTISKQTDERDGDTTDTETNNTYDVPAAYENSRAVSEVNSTTTGISMGKSARSRVPSRAGTITDETASNVVLRRRRSLD